MYANIVIEVLNPNILDTYTYIIPDELEGFVGLGSRVLVEFGARRILGYVIEITQTTTVASKLKEIIEVYDYSMELSNDQIELAKWISYETNTPLIMSISSMFPSCLKTKYRKYMSIINEDLIEPSVLFLFGGRKKVMLSRQLLKENPKIKNEILKKNIEITNDIYTYGKRKNKKIYYCNLNASNIYNKYSGVKERIINYLLQYGHTPIEELVSKVNCSMAMLFSMEKEEVIKSSNTVYLKEEENRITLKNLDFTGIKKEIKEKYTLVTTKPYLFYSNCETFTFEFVLDVVIDNLNINKKVLITTPTLLQNYAIYNHLNRLLKGYKVLNFSSDLKDSEYFDNYLSLKNHQYDIVITTSVGLLYDYQNIGCIICFDVVNPAYIKDKAPKLSSIPLLQKRSELLGSRLIFISNPFSVENFYEYHQAKYTLLKYSIDTNCQVSLVDMKNELALNREIISRKLESEINTILINSKQAMIILNTKGHSNYLNCLSCHKVLKCSKCGIPLTYYQDKNEVKCSYCNTKHSNCSCSETKYTLSGYGLERVNEEVKRLFPNATVLLLDEMIDYTDYMNITVAIESNEVDIIIGPNNITSLIKYSNVSLLGYIAIDNLLNVSDYRASYNTYALVNNALNVDKLVLQGFNLDHYAVTNAINNDFLSFYQKEIKIRESFKYPPFYELNKLIISGEYKEMYHCANYFKKVYSIIFKEDNCILGPTYNKLYKGVVLLIKHNDYDKLIKLINELGKKFENQKISFERFPKWFK